MECEEIRVDIRIPNPEGSKEAMRASQVMFKLNHTMPFTDEYNTFLKELFGENRKSCIYKFQSACYGQGRHHR